MSATATIAPGKLPATRTLKGPDKVAALLMTMAKPLVNRLLKQFDPEDIRLITRSVADLRPVPPQQIQTLIEDFADQFAAGASLMGTASEVERLLDGVLPREEIDRIMADLLGNADRSIWERISTVSETMLASYVLKEHPQTAAVILSKVKPSAAAKVMGHLPREFRDGVMRRMLTLKPIVDEAMRMLERTLHEEFMVNFSRNVGADSHGRIADIINKMERNQMEDVLESLATSRPKSAEILKGLLFTFDDIIKLTPKARTTLFDQVPNDKVVTALRGTDPGFRDTILQALSSRVRRMVEQELNDGQSIPARDVVDARRTITDLALEMAGRGEIELNSENDEDAYIR
jgi:flagellar motor switch protein FliG